MWNVAVVAAAYVFGGFCMGYYLVRILKGIDVRDVGSGSAGGTNAAKVLGPRARYVVGGLDLLKGMIAVAVAQWLGVGEVALGAVTFAVVLGHIFPVQLGFRGGKGIGTSIGALLVYSPVAALVIVVVAGVLTLVTRRMQVSGVTAYVVVATMAPIWAPSTIVWGTIALTSALVMFANRDNFLAEMRACTATGLATGSPRQD